MEMDDNKLKSLLQEAMEYEADCIMEEVSSDPNVKDAIAPEAIHDNLMRQIHERKAAEAGADANLSQEQKELIRLGKLYKKKRSRRKYIVLIAAVLCALGVGMVSFGDAEKVMQEVERMLAGREQTRVNTDNERVKAVKAISEEEAYQQIEEKFGFSATRMYYLPEGMDFVELIIEDDSQNARLYYEDKNEGCISYSIITNHRVGSIGIDVEDKLIQEYEKNIEGTIIKIQEYMIDENSVNRWMVSFVYEKTQYSIILTGLEEEEVEKIVGNLCFY